MSNASHATCTGPTPRVFQREFVSASSGCLLPIAPERDLVIGDQTHSVIDVFAPGTTKPIR